MEELTSKILIATLLASKNSSSNISVLLEPFTIENKQLGGAPLKLSSIVENGNKMFYDLMAVVGKNNTVYNIDPRFLQGTKFMNRIEQNLENITSNISHLRIRDELERKIVDKIIKDSEDSKKYIQQMNPVKGIDDIIKTYKETVNMDFVGKITEKKSEERELVAGGLIIPTGYFGGKKLQDTFLVYLSPQTEQAKLSTEIIKNNNDVTLLTKGEEYSRANLALKDNIKMWMTKVFETYNLWVKNEDN